MRTRFAAAAAALLISAATAGVAGADTLSTSLNVSNNQSGIMFDITVGGSSLSLQSLGVNVNGGTYDFEFYTIDGGINGNQSNAAAWTLRNSFQNVTSAGAGNLTNFDITDFNVTAGSTIGLYFTGTTPFSNIVQYGNGNNVGDVIASNSDLSILTGYGKSYPFAETFSPRNFSGSITYGAAMGAVPEPATWALMILGFGAVGGAMRRRQSVAAKVRFA